MVSHRFAGTAKQQYNRSPESNLPPFNMSDQASLHPYSKSVFFFMQIHHFWFFRLVQHISVEKEYSKTIKQCIGSTCLYILSYGGQLLEEMLWIQWQTFVKHAGDPCLKLSVHGPALKTQTKQAITPVRKKTTEKKIKERNTASKEERSIYKKIVQRGLLKCLKKASMNPSQIKQAAVQSLAERL